MSPLPENATSQDVVQVVSTITHRSETINVGDGEETTVQEVIEDIKTTISHTNLNDPDTIEIISEPADIRGESDDDDMTTGISMEQLLKDMVSAGLQPRGPNNNKPSATVIKKGDPIRDAKKNIKK